MSDNKTQGTVSKLEPSLVAQVHISVRGLVEFVLRHGDIDDRRKSSQGPEVMLEGANIHRMIQRRMGASYHAEYYLRHIIKRSEYEIVIDGRADGIIIPKEWEPYITECIEWDEGADSDVKPMLLKVLPDKKIVIDEIKTTYRDLDKIKEPESVHLAQAKCYAYFFALMNHLPEISVRMTYVNSESHEMRYFDSHYSYDEISEWFDEVITKYIRWADFEVNFRRIRNASIEAISFPYEYRKGQKELVAQVFSSIEKKEKLFVMAPTGVGKTLANMYPSLKALALGRAQRIFYLTAKTITRSVAADCLNLLRQQSMRCKSIVLTAKEKMCPLEKVECNPVKCPYAKGHFDRINDAMYDLLTFADDFSRETILEYADKHQVCPFEFSLDMSLYSDVIICDYNYAFDPNVYLRRFFSEGNSGEYLFLVDEAHNLTERAMSMYSAQLIKEDFLEVKRLVKDVDARLYRAIESANKALLRYKRECEDVKVVDGFDDLVSILLRLEGRIEQFLDDHDRFEHTDELLEFYFGIRHFLFIFENMNDEDYVSYTKITENGDFMARLMCANPSKWIEKCCQRARFTVFFSATLLPIEYYRKMLAAKDEDPAVYAKSVFDAKRRKILVARDVTSKYTRRNDAEYRKMAEYISQIAGAKSGNYMVFCPSFAMLDRVYESYMTEFYEEDEQMIVVQGNNMSEKDREDFIGYFTGEYDLGSKKTIIGFCVLGGIFSEGIDLKNDALIGAIIIGTGLPMVCAERELLRERYLESGLDGFAYAYRYPGMNKALQAAGRVIRTEEDKGVVALLDERYLGRDYLSLFPREWSDYERCLVTDAAECLETFWNQ